ncbi:MAG TPA: DUF2059 domain-containing protein [Verrucomicrobiae bacterium]|jgi:hypothetical protein|nr:DUF2059 domain-containing protein [Verrucomicrobiae bacterium]
MKIRIPTRQTAAFFLTVLLVGSQRTMAQGANINGDARDEMDSEAASKKADTEKLISAMGTEETLKRVLPQIVDQMKQAMPNVPEGYWRSFETNINFGELTRIYIPIYEKYFTHDEIKDMTRYYESPLGRKFVATMPKATEEAMAAVSVWSKELSERIRKQVESQQTANAVDLRDPAFKAFVLKKYGYDTNSYDLTDNGQIVPKSQTQAAPQPDVDSPTTNALPADVKYFIVVEKADGKNEWYLSKLEPTTYGSGFKFRAYPDNTEIMVSGNVTVRRLDPH